MAVVVVPGINSKNGRTKLLAQIAAVAQIIYSAGLLVFGCLFYIRPALDLSKLVSSLDERTTILISKLTISSLVILGILILAVALSGIVLGIVVLVGIQEENTNWFNLFDMCSVAVQFLSIILLIQEYSLEVTLENILIFVSGYIINLILIVTVRMHKTQLKIMKQPISSRVSSVVPSRQNSNDGSEIIL